MLEVKITLVNTFSLGVILILINEIFKLRKIDSRISQSTYYSFIDDTKEKYLVDLKILDLKNDELDENISSCNSVYDGYEEINLLAFIKYSDSCVCNIDYTESRYLFPDYDYEKNIQYNYVYYESDEFDVISSFEFNKIISTKTEMERENEEAERKKINSKVTDSCLLKQTEIRKNSGLDSINCKAKINFNDENRLFGKVLCGKYSDSNITDILSSIFEYLSLNNLDISSNYEYYINSFIKNGLKTVLSGSIDKDNSKFSDNIATYLSERFKVDNEGIVFLNLVDKEKLDNLISIQNKITETSSNNGKLDFEYLNLSENNFLVIIKIKHYGWDFNISLLNKLITKVFYISPSYDNKIYKNLLKEISEILRQDNSISILHQNINIVDSAYSQLAYSSYKICLNLPEPFAYLEVKGYSFSLKVYIILFLELLFYIIFMIVLNNQTKIKRVSFMSLNIPLSLGLCVQLAQVSLIITYIFNYYNNVNSYYYDVLLICPKIKDHRFEEYNFNFKYMSVICMIIQLFKVICYCWLFYDYYKIKSVIEEIKKSKDIGTPQEMRNIENNESMTSSNSVNETKEELIDSNKEIINDSVVQEEAKEYIDYSIDNEINSQHNINNVNDNSI